MGKKTGIGGIAFLVGIIGAVILGALSGLGIFSAGSVLILVLVIAGILIGLLNISAKESVPLMVSALVIGVGSGVLSVLPIIGGILESILSSLAQVVLPAGIVIAVTTVVRKAS